MHMIKQAQKDFPFDTIHLVIDDNESEHYRKFKIHVLHHQTKKEIPERRITYRTEWAYRHWPIRMKKEGLVRTPEEVLPKGKTVSDWERREEELAKKKEKEVKEPEKKKEESTKPKTKQKLLSEYQKHRQNKSKNGAGSNRKKK